MTSPLCCSIPLEARGGFSQCRMFSRNYSRLAETVELALGQTSDVLALEAALAALVPSTISSTISSAASAAGLWGGGNESVVLVASGEDTVPCAHGYAFDYSQYATTVVTEVSEAGVKSFVRGVLLVKRLLLTTALPSCEIDGYCRWASK